MSPRSWSRRTRVMAALLLFLLLPCLWPESGRMPVQGASRDDFNAESFWYYPWGKSGVHKGIDVFAPIGRPVQSPVEGLIVYRGELERGGLVVLVLGPKWRLHYFAHLQHIDADAGWFVTRGDHVGTVGDTGNARGKPAHLHYTKLSLLPLPWHWRPVREGWKRMFFLDPAQSWD